MRKTCVRLGLGLALMAWCLVPLVHAGEETKEVIAVGMADGTSSRSRDEALNDALRRAVEQGVGTFVSAELSVEQQQLVEERIYTESQGYVQSYRVTRESKEDGLYEVEIAALVKMGKLEGDLRSIGLLIQKKQNPRVMVVVTSQEVDSSYLGVQVEGNRQVENQVEGGLMRKGFQLVDAGQVARKKQLESLLLDGDPTRAAKMAKDFGAEILVQGEVRRSFVDVREVLGRQMRFFTNEVRLKALETDTAKILWSGYRTQPPSGAGSLIPLEESTSELIREMVAGILEQWRKDVYQAGSYQVEITRIAFNQLKAFKEGLSRIRGVGAVQTRNYQSGHALLQVQYQGPIAELADKIAAIKRPVPEITGLQANTIEIRIRK